MGKRVSRKLSIDLAGIAITAILNAWVPGSVFAVSGVQALFAILGDQAQRRDSQAAASLFSVIRERAGRADLSDADIVSAIGQVSFGDLESLVERAFGQSDVRMKAGESSAEEIRQLKTYLLNLGSTLGSALVGMEAEQGRRDAAERQDRRDKIHSLAGQLSGALEGENWQSVSDSAASILQLRLSRDDLAVAGHSRRALVTIERRAARLAAGGASDESWGPATVALALMVLVWSPIFQFWVNSKDEYLITWYVPIVVDVIAALGVATVFRLAASRMVLLLPWWRRRLVPAVAMLSMAAIGAIVLGCGFSPAFMNWCWTSVLHLPPGQIRVAPSQAPWQCGYNWWWQWQCIPG